jgi:hypothetical protein
MSTNIIALDQDHIYLNLQVQNQSLKDATTASIFKTFREPIIENPNLWYVSLVKAEVPMTYVPLFNFGTYCARPLTSPTNPQAELVITFTYLGVDYTSKLVYISGTASPASLQIEQFPVYTLDILTAMTNTAFQTAYNALPAPLQATLQGPPVVCYDPVNKLFAVQYPRAYTSNTLSPFYTGIQVWLNDNLYTFFDTLPFRVYDTTNGSNGYKNNLMFVDEVFTQDGSNIVNRTGAPVLNEPITSPLNGIAYYSMIQEVDSIASIYGVANVIFTSNLPTVPEYINSSNAGTTSLTSQETLVQFPILSEITPVPGDTGQRLLYIPSADFRLRVLSSNEPITTIQVNVLYQDKSGVIQPLRIPSKETMSLKLLFRKKTYQNATLLELNSLPEKDKKEIVRANFTRY